jgi:phosphate starvation-inducible PhoH-like protein
MPRAAVSERIVREVRLEPDDNRRLARLCGRFDENLRRIEERLGVEIRNRGNDFRILGDAAGAARAEGLLKEMYQLAVDDPLTPEQVHLLLQSTALTAASSMVVCGPDAVAIRTRRGMVRGRGANQQQYLQAILTHDINFGIGPAGTGKTYLAVAAAVEALERGQVRRIILVRPAVEAGERLGFLPGDMAQKVDPYLRPLFDALQDLLGPEKVERLMERGQIEVAPLAFMRGRTLNEAFIILDEAQNTTIEQMKMFLTRLGFGSTTVITGDTTQVDLPRQVTSGLRHAESVLNEITGISFTYFTSQDVVRHPLVQRIVDAYARGVDGGDGSV